MKIQSNSTNFKSNIKLISEAEFQNKVKKFNPKKHYIGYPWTADGIKKGKKLFTTSILDCIAGGIIDKNTIRMFHICTMSNSTAKKHNLMGFKIKQIEQRLLKDIDFANENLHAFILGGFQLREDAKYNINKLNKIKKIFEKNQIPYSIIGARRDVQYFGEYSLLYDNKTDTIFISNSLSRSSGSNEKPKEIEVFDNKIVYHTPASIKTGFKRPEVTGSSEDFFKSQFRQVSLCKFDKFI